MELLKGMHILLIGILLVSCNDKDDPIDPITDRQTKTISTELYPNGIGVSNTHVYLVLGEPHTNPASVPVAAGTTSKVKVFDLEGEFVTDIEVPGGGHSLRMTPDGKYAYIAHFSLDNVVSVISTETNTLITTVGGLNQTAILVPDAISISPNGDYVYVACNGPNSVGWISRISVSTNEVDSNWKLPVTYGFTCWVEAHPVSNHVYANSWTGGSVQLNDISSQQQIASVEVGDFPHAIVFNSDGSHLYALVSGGNKVLKVNATDLQIISEIPGPDLWLNFWGGPISGVLSKSGNFIFIANHGMGAVAVLDVNPSSSAYEKVVDIFKVGDDPIFQAVSRDGKTLYVANNGDGTFSIIPIDKYL